MEKKLIADAKAFLKKNYNMELNIPIKLNGRLSTTLGRFMHKRGRVESVRIEISRKFAELTPYDEVLTVLYHELIHHARYELGLSFHDGEPGFEADCLKFGATSSGATDSRLRMTRTAEYKGGRFVVYKCPCCNKEVTRGRRIPRTSYFPCCDGKMVEDRVEHRNADGSVARVER